MPGRVGQDGVLFQCGQFDGMPVTQRRVQGQLVGHARFQRTGETVVAQDAPLRVLDGNHHTPFGQVNPYFTHIVLPFYDAQRRREHEILVAHYLQQRTSFVIEVADRLDVGGDVVGQHAEGPHDEFLGTDLAGSPQAQDHCQQAERRRRQQTYHCRLKFRMLNISFSGSGVWSACMRGCQVRTCILGAVSSRKSQSRNR